MSKPRILFVTTNTHVPWGGSEVLWSVAAERMARGGEVLVYAMVRKWDDTPDHEVRLKETGVQIHYAREFILKDGGSTLLKIQKAINRRLHGSENIWEKQLEQADPDLVVFSHGNNISGTRWMEACVALGRPYLNLFQLATEVHWPKDDFIDRYTPLLKQATTNFFVSKDNQRLTERMYALDLSNGRLAHNPYNVSGAYLPYPEASDVFSLACPANFYALHKGQDILLEVLADPFWRDQPLEVTFYGKGVHERWLRRTIERLDLQKVHVSPFVADIEEVWRVSHALVMPSRMEGMSLSLIEAMHCGRVPIVTQVGGVEQLVVDKETGFVAAYPSAEALDEALKRAWESRSEWEEMGKRCHARMQEIYPDDPVGDFTGAILDLLPNSNRTK